MRPRQNTGQNTGPKTGPRPAQSASRSGSAPLGGQRNFGQKNDEQTIGGKSFALNEQIKAKEVRIIDHNGQMLGVLPVAEGIKIAQDAGLDLIEVSPNAEPPVCKIANFGKMRYELQKKASDAKKKQKVVETKEIKMSINIGKNDFEVKVRHILKFIEQGDKVKVAVRMKGREITHLDLAKEIMKNVLEQTDAVAKPESNPRLEGMQIIAILVKK